MAEWLVDKFDIVKGEVLSDQARIDIWLDEKRIVPTDYYAAHQVITFGFTPEKLSKNYLYKILTISCLIGFNFVSLWLADL